MDHHDIIVIGASAGGIEALINLVKQFPDDLPASIFIVVHLAPNNPSVLPEILERAGKLPASHPVEGEKIRKGHIYVAPPNLHMMLVDGSITLSYGPRENRARPAIDALFRTAAASYRSRVIGVILTGSLSDGAAGLQEVKRHEGIAIVQDPLDAIYPEMPQSAINRVNVDYILPIRDMGAKLTELVKTLDDPSPMTPLDEAQEKTLVASDLSEQAHNLRNMTTSVYSCPDCGGVLWEVDEGNMLRFRCHVGHTFSAESLLDGQTDGLETALWSAVRTMREKSTLLHQLAEQMHQKGNAHSSRNFEVRAHAMEEQLTLLQQMLISGGMQSSPKDY